MYLVLLLHLFCFTHIVAQEITISLIGSTNKALLFELEGEETQKIDSIISENGIFHFSFNEKHNGFYRFKFDHNKWLDFINDGKDVELKTNENNILDSLRVINPESNHLYYSFIKLFSRSFKR